MKMIKISIKQAGKVGGANDLERVTQWRTREGGLRVISFALSLGSLKHLITITGSTTEQVRLNGLTLFLLYREEERTFA